MKKEQCEYCLKYFRLEEIADYVFEETGEKVCKLCLRKLELGKSIDEELTEEELTEEELTEEEIQQFEKNLVVEYCRRNRLKLDDIIIKNHCDMTDEDFMNSDMDINGKYIVRKKK